jgi:outer membrane receptor protein involved in Fe transport
VGVGVFGRYTGKKYVYHDTVNQHQYGDYWLCDISAYVRPTENTRVSLYLANVFDKGYAPRVARAGSGSNTFYYADPRGNPFSATLTASYTF